MNYSEDIDNLLNGNQVYFNNDYVVIEFEVEYNTWISTYIKVSIEYKYRDNEDWKTKEVLIPWNYRPANKKEQLIVPASNSGTIILKNLYSSAWFNSISIEGKNIELDDMTAQELLLEIESLRNELESLRNSISQLPNMNDYVTNQQLESNNYLTEHQDLSSYVSKVELDSCGYITNNDITNLATTQYVDNKVSSIDISNVEFDLSSYVSKVELDSCGYITNNDITNFATTEYVDTKVSSIDVDNINIDLSDYVSKNELTQCAYITLDDIPASSGNYDDTAIKNDINSLNEKINKYIQGPSAVLSTSTIEYGELTTKLIDLFNVNDLFEYRFSRPYLVTTYNQNIWDESPYPVYDSATNSYTFKENIDIVDFEYRITAYCDSENYQEDFILTQECTDRIYFPYGNTLTFETYSAKTVNLSTYIITNYSDYSVDDESFIIMNNLGGITFNSNSNSNDSRSITITINNNYTFTIIQPGNPDYGGTPIDEPALEEIEYTLNLSLLTDDTIDGVAVKKIEQDGILLIGAKGSGQTLPALAQSQLRFYASNTISISSEYTITKIEFTRASHTKNATLTSETPTLNEIDASGIQIWEGNSDSVEFLLSNGSGVQYRVTSLKITLLK